MSSPTQAFSGKDGTVKYIVATSGTPVTELFEVADWKFSPKATNPAICSNRTGGFKSRSKGVRDSSGSVTVKTPEGTVPPFRDGDSVVLDLIDGHGVHFTVPAMVSGMPYECNIDNGDHVGYSYEFEGTAAWTMSLIGSSGT
jgi:hypothetical protein